jgi:hypothetical protein
MEQRFPAAPTYGSAETVIGPDGKPTLVRFPKTGGPPQPVEGYKPYEKPGSSDTTALMKDVPYIARVLGISEKEAMQWKRQSASMSRDDFRRDVALRFASQGYPAEEAQETADEYAKIFYDGQAKPRAEAPSPGILDRIAGFFTGDEATAGNRPEGEIEAMSQAELMALIHGPEGDNLSEEDARRVQEQLMLLLSRSR